MLNTFLLNSGTEQRTVKGFVSVPRVNYRSTMRQLCKTMYGHMLRRVSPSPRHQYPTSFNLLPCALTSLFAMQLYTILAVILAVSPGILAGPCTLSMFCFLRVLINLHSSDPVPQTLTRRTEPGNNTPCLQGEVGQARCIAGDERHIYQCIHDQQANPPRFMWRKLECSDDR